MCSCRRPPGTCSYGSMSCEIKSTTLLSTMVEAQCGFLLSGTGSSLPAVSLAFFGKLSAASLAVLPPRCRAPRAASADSSAASLLLSELSATLRHPLLDLCELFRLPACLY
ncbi:hypothetical protein Q8A67_023731 [Cirrhinus molitorella]|uniref:Uncharacterized protein n=1 Tax=Cirrhinus molitorella TaxID=172907 RepID=A0AA88P401_9TELE|nr:hypothetical protein Q8A67_023731 [Cirrhinus molitorella]